MSDASSKPTRLMHRRHDAKGRSTGRVTAQARGRWKAETPFVQLTRRLLLSPAWGALSINARRLIDFLMIENMNHAGVENGRLYATYHQLVRYGLSRAHIREAVEECERLGLVRRGAPRMQRVAARYRLTFLQTINTDTGLWAPPSNDWERLSEEDIHAFQYEVRGRRKGHRIRLEQKRNAGSGSSTKQGQECAPHTTQLAADACIQTAGEQRLPVAVPSIDSDTASISRQGEGLEPPSFADPIAFGVWLKNARVAKGLSQAAIAQRIGLSRSGFGNIESGRFAAGAVTRRRLVAILSGADQEDAA